VIRHGVLAASRGGKVKTLLQSVAIGLFLLPPWALVRDLAWAVMLAAIVVGVATGVDYVGRALSLRRRSTPRVPASAAVAGAPPARRSA
jgi:CDP-diacylglycerol--glycerol-3-phosphate 3-phosphatidyltransferase